MTNMCINKNLFISLRRFVPMPFQGVGLKGNQVRILNRPAAVSPFGAVHSFATASKAGRRTARVSQKTCKTHICVIKLPGFSI